MEKLLIELESTGDFTKEVIEEILRNTAESLDVQPAELIHPVRLAVTGMTVGPGLFELLALLGKERVVRRIKAALERLP